MFPDEWHYVKMARSSPRMQFERVSPFDSVEARSAMQIVRTGPSTCLLHLCGDKSDEKICIFGVERIAYVFS